MSAVDPYKQATNREAVDPYKQETNRESCPFSRGTKPDLEVLKSWDGFIARPLATLEDFWERRHRPINGGILEYCGDRAAPLGVDDHPMLNALCTCHWCGCGGYVADVDNLGPL